MSAVDLVNASRQTPPVPIGMLPAGAGPTTCHEAVLGWLLMAHQVNQPWQLLEALRHKLIQDTRAPLGGGTLVTGDWMYRNIYTTSTQMRLGWLHQNLAPGDVVFTGRQIGTNHSMVVVANTGPFLVKIRGFNNRGTFGDSAPLLAYDNTDRDIAVAHLWDMNNRFGNNIISRLELHKVDFSVASAALERAIPRRGPGAHWQYDARLGGWHFR